MRLVKCAAASVACFLTYLVLSVVIGFGWLWLIARLVGLSTTWWAQNVGPYVMTILIAAFSAGVSVGLTSALFRRLAMLRVALGFVGLLNILCAVEAFWRLHHPSGPHDASYVQLLLTALAAAITAIDQAHRADRARGLSNT